MLPDPTQEQSILPLLFALFSVWRTTKTRPGFEVPAVEVPMEFVAGWHMSTRDIQRSACFIEWLEGAVGHCGNLVGIATRHSSLYLIKVLLRPYREDAAHFLAHLLHFVFCFCVNQDFANSTYMVERQRWPVVGCCSESG